MSKNIVSGLSFKQGAEFMQVLQKAGLGSQEAQRVIEGSKVSLATQLIRCINRNGLSAPLSKPEKLAAEILGRQRVVSCYEVAECLELAPGVLYQVPSTFFTVQSLKKAAFENLNADADWRLVFISGLSISDMRKRQVLSVPYGHDGYKLPSQTRPGYHLINFKPFFLDEVFGECETRMHKEQKTRVDDLAFMEALYTIGLVSGDCLFGEYSHWSSVKVPYSDPAIWTISCDFGASVKLEAKEPRKHDINLGVVASISPDCPISDYFEQ